MEKLKSNVHFCYSDGMIERLQQAIESRRTAFRHLPRFIQILLIVLAFGIGGAGIIALLPLPERGIPLMLAALGILSFEYKWAQRLLLRAINLFQDKKYADC